MTDWAMKSKIQMSVKIPRKIAGLPDIQFHLFCYPEFSAQRKQLETRTLDFSHVLTNVRMHICRHGYDFCKTEHFLELCLEGQISLVIPLLRTGLIHKMYSQQLIF